MWQQQGCAQQMASTVLSLAECSHSVTLVCPRVAKEGGGLSFLVFSGCEISDLQAEDCSCSYIRLGCLAGMKSLKRIML